MLIIGSPVTSHAEQVAQVNNVMSYRQLGTTSSPVVSNLVRDDLTSHVKTWPGDILAKQVILLNTFIQYQNKFNVLIAEYFI